MIANNEQQTAARIAALLRYPQQQLERRNDDGEEITAFFDEVAHVDASGLEELYTRTFDLNPVATLEAGWHLWGEQYERGRFLADLRPLQASLGIDSGCELPDHLTVLLPTVAATRTAELRENCTKAIDKILIPLEEHGNPYRHLLRAARQICDSVAVIPSRSGEAAEHGDGSPASKADHAHPEVTEDPSPSSRLGTTEPRVARKSGAIA